MAEHLVQRGHQPLIIAPEPTGSQPAKRSAAPRRELAPGGEVLAGYVGRLATGKRVDLLALVAELPA